MTERMTIQLVLKHHCIQTAVKKAYERLLRACLKHPPGDDAFKAMEADIERLKFFLETCDFPHMRSQYPELSGREEVSVTLELKEGKGDMVLICGGRRIYPRWKVA